MSRPVDLAPYMRGSAPARLEAVSGLLNRLAADIRLGGLTDAEIAKALELPEAFLQIVRDDVSGVTAARAARAAARCAGGSRRRQ
jgi:hypothetical protein